MGFESSDTRALLAEVLESAGYSLQEFILSPTQLGVPYSRPRYFALARRTMQQQQQPAAEAAAAALGQSIGGSAAFALPPRGPGAGPYAGPPSALLAALCVAGGGGRDAAAPAAPTAALAPLRALGDFLVIDPGAELAGGVLRKRPGVFPAPKRKGGSPEAGADSPDAAASTADAAGGGDPCGGFAVPEAVVRRHGWCFDIVTPQDGGPSGRPANCFTKTYGDYIKASR